uniref:SID1 transmembrane family member 1 n=1 Tax=Clastoptera arizonana TaxID=38151 RepID=A0A1B6CMV4_9HEMI
MMIVLPNTRVDVFILMYFTVAQSVPGLQINDSGDCISSNLPTNVTTERNNVQPIVCDGKINTVYQVTLNYSVTYIYQFPAAQVQNPTRITVESKSANPEYPIIVVVEQQESVLSWQLPLILQHDSDSYSYEQTSHTLCPNGEEANNDEIIIIISTRSKIDVTLTLKAVLVDNFNVNLKENRTITVTPSEPQYYKFIFSSQFSSATLFVESHNLVCMTLSIQNITCPVTDLQGSNNNIGMWETVSSKGGIMLTRAEYPLGFYIVFIVHSDDNACFTKSTFQENRSKTLSFRLEPSLGPDKYLIAILAVFGILFVFCLIVCFTHFWIETRDDHYNRLINDELPFIQDSSNPLSSGTPVYEEEEEPPPTEGSVTCCCWSWIDSDNGNETKYVNQLTQRNPALLRLESNLFFWNLLIVALFYSLPVVQLVFTQQKNLNEYGNQDLCYYNFLCTHHLFFMTDFNHIFSNIGYVVLGAIFIIIVMRREANRVQYLYNYGLPPQYGLYYALGMALVMEGVLSGCYHVCPNKTNFQFDTSFMYVLSILSMLRMYQARHADINANAHSAYGVLAIIIFSGMCGILLNSMYFYILFTVFHLLFCLFLSAQIYFFGRLKIDLSLCHRILRAVREEYNAGVRNCCKPLYPSRMLLLLLGNMCNWALVAVGWYQLLEDFATYLLTVLISNLFLYLFFYVVMKFYYKEKILLQTKLYILLALILWSTANYFFYFRKIISWKVSICEP